MFVKNITYVKINRRDVMQNFNLITCRTLQNVIFAPRHQIMVNVNEIDRMDCLYRRNALGRIYKSAPTNIINSMTQSG